MWPCKNISHIQVQLFTFFPTPPIKLKNQDCKYMWGRLLIATHLIQSNVYLVQSRAGVRLWWCTFHQPQQNCESWAKSIFAEPNRYIFNFSSSHFVFQGHILSTSGVAFSRKYSCSTAPTTTTVIILLWCRQFIHNPTTVLTAAISLPLSVLCVCS
jgi:hypothetical protein